MNAGKVFVLGIVLSGLIAGVAMYYLQVYAFYTELEAEDAQVQLTTLDGVPEDVFFEEFQGIDSDSSPIRYRACFQLEMSQAALTETYQITEAEPLVAPGWFDCFDAREIGEALVSGTAVAFMGVENIEYGIDRVVAVMPDGQAYAWHMINACGEVVFDGDPAPEGCPPVPEREQ